MAEFLREARQLREGLHSDCEALEQAITVRWVLQCLWQDMAPLVRMCMLAAGAALEQGGGHACTSRRRLC